MAKVRGRSVKPKIQKGDFSKKKTKVGRKVKRANVTEIKVKSRRIVVPLQNQGISEDGESNREAINRVIKQLHHYSESTRLNALNRVKDMLNTKISEESFVTLVLPEVIELLFNDEKETRSVVTEVISSMFAKFPSDAFLPVLSVTVTYICSGLTNLHKGIRKDSLVLLKAMAQRCPTLLAPHLDKLLRHALLLLTDSFQSVSAPLTQQRDALVTSGMQVAAVKTSSSGPTGSAKSVTPTMFILILEVLASLLEHCALRGYISRSGSTDEESALSFQFNSQFSSNAALLFNSFGNRLTAATHTSESTGVSPALMEEILENIGIVWRNLVMNSSALSMDVLSSLLACTKILLCAAQLTAKQAQDSSTKLRLSQRFSGIIQVLFQHFPHTCIEASLAAPGSEKERSGLQRIAQLDVALCEISFVYLSSLEYTGSNTESIDYLRSVATSYLLQTLRVHISAVSSDVHVVGTIRDGPNEQERAAAVKIFRSFELLLSRNTMGALSELLDSLAQLFAALEKVPIGSRRGFNYLAVPASECLCCIIQRVHQELGEEYGEALYCLLVRSLTSAIALALSASWDQTALIEKLSSSMLLILQGKVHTFDSKELSQSVARLCEIYIEFWPMEELEEEDSVVGAFRNNYSSCTEAAKFHLLDVFLYASMEDIYTHAAHILEYLCLHPDASMQERSYFLRVIFERRQELGLRDFVELLFTSLQQYLANIDTGSEDAASAAMPLWGARWYAHDVADVLLWMASSEAPAKIVLFLGETVEELLEIAIKSAQSSSSEGAEEEEGEVENVPWMRSAVLVLCQRLLVPWATTTVNTSVSAVQEGGDSDEVAVHRLLDWIAAVAQAVLLEEGGCLGGSKQADALAELLSLRLSYTNTTENTHNFAVYSHVLSTVTTTMHKNHTESTSTQLAENILRNLNAVLQSCCFDELIFIHCRADLEVFTKTLSSTSGSSGSNGQQSGSSTLVQNLATDMLALF